MSPTIAKLHTRSTQPTKGLLFIAVVLALALLSYFVVVLDESRQHGDSMREQQHLTGNFGSVGAGERSSANAVPGRETKLAPSFGAR